MNKRNLILIIILIAFLILLFCFVVLRIYHLQNVKDGYILRDEKKYIISAVDLETIVKDLDKSYMYRDSPSCGFAEDFSMVFLNSDKQLISRLFIAWDGCPIFRIEGTQYYLEGKETTRKIINDIVLCKNHIE